MYDLVEFAPPGGPGECCTPAPILNRDARTVGKEGFDDRRVIGGTGAHQGSHAGRILRIRIGSATDEQAGDFGIRFLRPDKVARRRPPTGDHQSGRALPVATIWVGTRLQQDFNNLRVTERAIPRLIHEWGIALPVGGIDVRAVLDEETSRLRAYSHMKGRPAERALVIGIGAPIEQKSDDTILSLQGSHPQGRRSVMVSGVRAETAVQEGFDRRQVVFLDGGKEGL